MTEAASKTAAVILAISSNQIFGSNFVINTKKLTVNNMKSSAMNMLTKWLILLFLWCVYLPVLRRSQKINNIAEKATPNQPGKKKAGARITATATKATPRA